MKDGYYVSDALRQRVYVHKVVRDSNIPYDCCERCGKLLTRVFYSINDERGLEALYGSECIKALGLRRCRRQSDTALLDRMDVLEYAEACGREAAANLLLLAGPDGYAGSHENYKDLEALLVHGPHD